MPNKMDQKIKTENEKQAVGHGFQTSNVAGIALIHFIHDSYTSFLAPLLPLLIQRMGLTITEAGSLSVFMQIPSLFNPFLGNFADRRRMIRLFIIISPAITAVAMSLIGLAPGYGMLAILLLTAGISTAMLHVSAPVMVARLSGSAVGRGMSFFMLGGELARTFGPIIAVWAVSTLTLEGLWKLIPAGLFCSLIVWRRMRGPSRDSGHSTASIAGMLKQMRMIMTGVVGILIARSFMAAATTTYLPTFMVERGHNLWLAGISLSVVELAGAVGAFGSGTLSDFIGRRRVLLLTILFAPAALIGMIHSEGALQFASLAALGFFTISSGPVMMAMVLENAGENRAAANGMLMAVSFAARGMIVLLVGVMSDAWGMQLAFTLCAGAGLLGLPFLLLLPKT